MPMYYRCRRYTTDLSPYSTMSTTSHSTCKRCGITPSPISTNPLEVELARDLPVSFYCYACVFERNDHSSILAQINRHPEDECACCVYTGMLSDHHLPLDDTHVCVKCKCTVCGICLSEDTALRGQCYMCAEPESAKQVSESAAHRRAEALKTEATWASRRREEIAMCKALRRAQIFMKLNHWFPHERDEINAACIAAAAVLPPSPHKSYLETPHHCSGEHIDDGISEYYVCDGNDSPRCPSYSGPSL
jgi:hypothetical protein